MPDRLGWLLWLRWPGGWQRLRRWLFQHRLDRSCQICPNLVALMPIQAAHGTLRIIERLVDLQFGLIIETRSDDNWDNPDALSRYRRQQVWKLHLSNEGRVEEGLADQQN